MAPLQAGVSMQKLAMVQSRGPGGVMKIYTSSVLLPQGKETLPFIVPAEVPCLILPCFLREENKENALLINYFA